MTIERKNQIKNIFMITALFIITGFLLPWWLMPVVALVYGVFVGAKDTSTSRFITQIFSGVFLAWGLVAFYFDARAGFHLSPRIGGLFKLEFVTGGTFLVALLGALLATLFALAGASLRIGSARFTHDRP